MARPTDHPPEAADCLTPRQVAAKLQIGFQTFERQLARGDFPQPMRFGKTRRWLRSAVEKYLADRDRAAQKAAGRPRSTSA